MSKNQTAPKTTPAPNASRAAQAASVPTPAKEPKEPKVDATLTKTITVLSDKNPKRENSASHARFAIYKTGMTVEAYITQCVADGQLRRAARADIDWDVKHKFIELKG